jgi:4'-phosphopantetheinyl transferase
MADILDPAHVHIWFFAWDTAPSAALVQTVYASLSSDEQERYGRFHFERDRHAYLFAHGLLRRILSQYECVPEACWRFECNRYGKPFVASPRSGLYFSLTHTAGMVACAISSQAEVGVDAERVDRPCEFLTLAHRYFAPAEARSLESAPPELLPERFFTFWTLKEAYIKARGMGLSLPLQDFEVRLEKGGVAGIANDADWHLRTFRPTPAHILSAAVRVSCAPEFLLNNANL